MQPNFSQSCVILRELVLMIHFLGCRPLQGSARADREDLRFGNVGDSPISLQTYQCGGQKLSYHMALIVSKYIGVYFYNINMLDRISENFDISLTDCLNTYIVTWEASLLSFLVFFKPFLATLVALHFNPVSESVSHWAEFRTSVASRLVSLFLQGLSRHFFFL